MNTLTITLPESLRPFIDARVAEGGYASIDDYLGGLVLADRHREEQMRFEALIHEGIDSGSFVPEPEEYWESKRRAVLEKYGEAPGPTS